MTSTENLGGRDRPNQTQVSSTRNVVAYYFEEQQGSRGAEPGLMERNHPNASTESCAPLQQAMQGEARHHEQQDLGYGNNEAQAPNKYKVPTLQHSVSRDSATAAELGP